jgi:DNA-binding NtrC family response regulator
MSEAKLLVVDEEKGIGDLLSMVLSNEGYRVVTATHGESALEKLNEESPDIVLLDIQHPDLDGMELLRQVKKANSQIPVIMLATHGTTQSVIEAMRLGAYDYINKPIAMEDVKQVLDRAMGRYRLPQERISPVPELKDKYLYENIIGKSRQMLDVYKIIGKVSDKKTSVLIRGESGTGKELVARAVHYSSMRADKPFVAVDCASLTPTLLESELFGHERGAFTDAIRRKLGRFEVANGGTIFLDEIGNLHLDMQAKLLRVLQERKIVRVGGTQPVNIDVRVIAATNKDLEAAMKEGSFKADLYYRISVVPIYLPPLRDRLEDTPDLVEHFLRKYKDPSKETPKRISGKALDLLLRYHWPGNARELENIIERAVVTGADEVIWPEDLPPWFQEIGHGAPDEHPVVKVLFDQGLWEKGTSYSTALRTFEETLLRMALIRANGNTTQAARLLKMSPRTLRYKISKYHLQKGWERRRKVRERKQGSEIATGFAGA